jgi:hypothetical protein
MFDRTKGSVLEGYGINKETFLKIKSDLIPEGIVLNQAVEDIENSNLSEDFKKGIIFELGANYGFTSAIENIKAMHEEESLKHFANSSPPIQ